VKVRGSASLICHRIFWRLCARWFREDSMCRRSYTSSLSSWWRSRGTVL